MNNGTPFVWRWATILLAGAVIGAAVGYGAATAITKTYEAETQLLVGPLNTTFDLDASGQLARTYAELGEGRPILASAIQTAGAKLTPTELKEATAIDSNEITRIIAIRVQDKDPRQAARLANAIAAQLFELSSERRAKARSGLDAFEREPEISRLSADSQKPILEAAERVFSGSVAGKLQITDKATEPKDPVRPSVPLIVIFGALAGLLLAAGIAKMWEGMMDQTQPQHSFTPYVPPESNGASFAPPPGQARDPWGALISESRPELGSRDR